MSVLLFNLQWKVQGRAARQRGPPVSLDIHPRCWLDFVEPGLRPWGYSLGSPPPGAMPHADPPHTCWPCPNTPQPWLASTNPAHPNLPFLMPGPPGGSDRWGHMSLLIKNENLKKEKKYMQRKIHPERKKNPNKHKVKKKKPRCCLLMLFPSPQAARCAYSLLAIWPPGLAKR